MWDIIHKVFVEIGIAFVSICHIRALIKEDWEYVKPVTQFIERRLNQRRKNMGLPTAKQIGEGFGLLNVALANAPKILTDLAAAEAASKDPVAEIAAAQQLAIDTQAVIQSLVALFPAPAPAANTITPSTTPVA